MAVIINAKAVAALRAKTGCGMMECKKALVETEGDEEKAIKVLREKGLATAAKKADRIAAEGMVDILRDGNRVAMDVKPGDVVLFAKFAGTEIKLDGVDHIILSEDDILAILD